VDIQSYIRSGIIESYVLGLSSEEETTEVDQLRQQYPEIEQAIANFSIQIEKQAIDNAIAPPDELKDRILQVLNEERLVVQQEEKEENEKKGATVIPFSKWKTVAAASVILLLVSTGLNFYFYNRYNDKEQAYQALLT
jgi:anti-sigma-K factor RskA